MGLFDIFSKKQEPIKEPEQRDFFAGYFGGLGLTYNSVSSFQNSQSLRLSAVYCAVNSISNTVANLPLNIYLTDSNGFKMVNNQHPLNYLLNTEPTKNLSKFNFLKLVVSSIILKGNAYVIIVRDGENNIKELRFIQPERVTVNYNQQQDIITYYIQGFKQPFKSNDVLHFWQYSNDLVNGLSVINYAVHSLKSANDAETHAANFFKSGAATSGFLKTNSTNGLIKPEQVEQIRNSWNSAFSGSQNGVAIVPNGFDYTPISINAKDAQLLETRQFNIVEIARFFNISPVKLFDLTNSSYSSLEQTQLSFLEDTIKPYLTLIENEFNRKIFNDGLNTVKFDFTEMLSTDKQALAEYYKTMLVNGIMTINEVRKALNLNDVDNGNELYMQLNMSTVKNINNQTPPDQSKLKQNTKQ